MNGYFQIKAFFRQSKVPVWLEAYMSTTLCKIFSHMLGCKEYLNFPPNNTRLRYTTPALLEAMM